MATINNISDCILSRLCSDGDSDVNHLKLQKLLFYVQAWNLAFYGRTIFDGKFQAWIHGPVNREIYDLYKGKKFLYSLMTVADITNENFKKDLTADEVAHVDSILDTYAKYTPSQLEYMTHREDPWIIAREGVSPHARSENTIDEKLMETYYKARL